MSPSPNSSPGGRRTGVPPARSLADWLRGWDDEQLEGLVRARPDLVVPVPQDSSVLALRASERSHVGRALDQLDAFVLSVLDRILLGARPVLIDDVAAAPEARAAVARLIETALIWESDAGLTPVSGVAGTVPRPAGLGRPLATLLRFVDRDALGALLDRYGMPRATDPDALPGRLTRALTEALAEIDDAELDLLRHLDRSGSVGALADASVPSDSSDPSPVRRLLARGLLLPIDTAAVEVPREVGVALRGPDLLPDVPATPPPITSAGPRRPDAEAESALVASNAVRLTALLLADWEQRPPTELKAGGLAQRDVKALAKVLDAEERDGIVVLETARAAGLVGRTTSLDASFAPTAAYDEWLASPVPSRWALIARAWIESPVAPSLVGRRDDREKPVAPLSGAAYHPAVRDLRRTLLRVLADLPANVVPTRDSVLAQLEWHSPRQFRAEVAPLVDDVLREAAFLGITAGGQLARYARPLLEGDEAGAAELLGGDLPHPVDYLLLQADLTAVAPGLLAPSLADDLATLADVESPGGATVYRFTERTIRRALDVGWDAARILDLLREVGRPAVPQALSYLVEDVARRHGRLRIGSAGAYIRCDDEALLTEVVADRRCASLRLRRIAPTVVVSPLGVGALLDQLRGAGYSPIGEREDGSVNLARRTGARAARAIAVPSGERIPDARMVDRIVSAIRAGDRVRAVSPATALRARGINASLALLEQAIDERRPVILGYVDAQGSESRRVVDPERLGGGLLTAYDQQRQDRRTFLLSRITELGLADESGA